MSAVSGVSIAPRAFIAPLILLLAAHCAFAGSIDDYVRSEMQQKHIPGAVLVVLRNGKVQKQRSYGVANIELGVPMRDPDAFVVASITKIFVATAAFLLVQDGKLRLNEKVNQILPGLPEAWRDITVRHCLSHISGIPDIVKYRPGGFQWLAGTQDDALKLLSSMPLEHKPGETSGYNGTEFLVVKMIIEKVSGMPLEEFLAQRIFEPLKMRSARYGDTLDVIPNRVTAYTAYSPSEDRTVAYDEWDKLIVSNSEVWNYRIPYPNWLYGAAGLNISALDLAKFDAALSEGTLLTKSSLEEMWTPYRLANGELGRFTNGWLTNLDPSNPYEVVLGIIQRLRSSPIHSAL